jgi:hypothetical protein
MRRIATGIALALAIATVLIPRSGTSEAGWLSRLSREAGDAGAGAGKLSIELGALGEAAALVAKLPPAGKGIALAAHVSPEGHWTLASREGQVFTAATREEMARAVKTLEPSAPDGSALSLYLSEDAVFKRREALAALPQDARLHVVSGGKAYALRAQSGGPLLAEVRPNLVVELGEERLFGEAIYHLSRAINKSSIRVLALEPGGPRTLSSVPSYDPATKAALVDSIDPAVFPEAMGRLKHQTVLVTGRVEGGDLVFKPSSGPESRISVAALGRAAEEAGASLVVLQSSKTRQPGGRNWLWQTVTVKGLDEALERATYADFLNALAAGRGELIVSARASTSGRIVLAATSTGRAASPITDAVGTWVTDKGRELMGQMIVEGVEAFVPDRERQEELDLRIVPGIPSGVQFAYLGCLLLGLMGWERTFAWFARIWPPETRAEYRGAAGYHAARLVRVLAMILIFVPLAAIPAVASAVLAQLWRVVTAPVRFLRWLAARLGGRRMESA